MTSLDDKAEIRRLQLRINVLEIHLKRALRVCEKHECVDAPCSCPGWHARETAAAQAVLRGDVP